MSVDKIDDLNNTIDKRTNGESCIQYSKNSVYKDKLRISLKNYDVPPKKIFFVYMSLDNEKRLDVVHYEYKQTDKIEIKNAEDVIEKCGKSIFHQTGKVRTSKNGKLDKSLPGTLSDLRMYNFDEIEWNSSCYVVLIMNDEYWNFHSHLSPNRAVQHIIKDEFGGTHPENYSFFDGKNTSIDASLKNDGSDMVTIFYMVNHFKKDMQGTPIQNADKPIKHKFDIFLRVSFANAGVGPTEKTVILDPTGTNDGPLN